VVCIDVEVVSVYVFTENGKLINLNAIQCIQVNEILTGLYAVFADDYSLYTCSSEDEGKQIIDCIAKAIKADTKVYYGRFRA
jgi:hypothetical protein